MFTHTLTGDISRLKFVLTYHTKISSQLMCAMKSCHKPLQNYFLIDANTGLWQNFTNIIHDIKIFYMQCCMLLMSGDKCQY